jgi:hypothetical protein
MRARVTRAGEDFCSGCGDYGMVVPEIMLPSLAHELAVWTGMSRTACDAALRYVYQRGMERREDIWMRLARDHMVACDPLLSRSVL